MDQSKERIGLRLTMTKNFCISVDIVNSLTNKWWLDAGTCLGVTREMDFIAYDYDIDFGIFSITAPPKDRFISSFQSFGASFIKERTFRNQLVTLGFKLNEVRIDINFYHQEDNFLWHALHKKGIFYPVVFDAKLFDKPKLIRFKGKDCFLPNPPEKYLEARYGEDWRVPKVDFVYWDASDTKAINMNFLGEQ